MILKMVLAVAATLLSAPVVSGDWFGSGEHRFEISFVPIGDVGNQPDTSGQPSPAGRVEYPYRIGQFEVSTDEVRKAIESSSRVGDTLAITIDDREPDLPATGVNWFEAARFVNWLNTSTGASPAYRFDSSDSFQLWTPLDEGYDPSNPFRNTRARYFLPNVDEWYKAAYYDANNDVYWDYPNGSDDPPVAVASGTDPNTAVHQQVGPAPAHLAGGPSLYGTIGQAGNVWEWNETTSNLLNDDPDGIRIARGGPWGGSLSPNTSLSALFFGQTSPYNGASSTGFRVASVPEPSARLIVALACLIAQTAVIRR